MSRVSHDVVHTPPRRGASGLRRDDQQRGVPVQVKVSARHGHLSEEHQGEIREKAEKLLHYFDRLTFIEVTVVFLKGEDKEVEVLATAEHKHEFVGHGNGPDVMLALGGAIEKAKQQIKHYKERVQDHRRDPHGGPDGVRS
jgi:putative sigma-54 modulation protein